MATKKTASKNNEQVISIAPIDIRKVNIRIRGTAPIIMHKWSEKAKKMILDKQTGETQTEAREKKNPVQDFISSAYWLTEEPKDGTEEAFEAAVANGARWGFPVTAIKQAAIVSASRTGLDIKGTVLRASFFIEGEGPLMLAEVKGCVPHMREDMVKVGGMTKTADIRYRAQFDDWYMDLVLDYNAGGPIKLDQIVNLINLAGFSCGIGEWRPEKDGCFGTFRVENVSSAEG